MSSMLLEDPPFKMATPDILLPPEVLWNLSRLSKYLMLSWNSSEEGDHATISLMFDKTKPSKVRPTAARNKLPLLPLLPELPRRSSSDIHPDFIDMDNARTSSPSFITISPDKGGEPVTVKRERVSPVKTAHTENYRKINSVFIKKELQDLGNQHQPTKSEQSGSRDRIQTQQIMQPSMTMSGSTNDTPDRFQLQQMTSTPITMPGSPNSSKVEIPPQKMEAKPTTPKRTTTRNKDRCHSQQAEPPVTVSGQTSSTRDQIDSIIRACRAEADKLPNTAFSDHQEQEVRHVFVPNPLKGNQKARGSRSVAIASRLLSAAKSSPRGTPGKRSERRKASSKNLSFQQECGGLKATLYTKDDKRKRKVFRKVHDRPNKRRSVPTEDTKLSDTDNGGESRTVNSNNGEEDRGAANDRNMETEIPDFATVEHVLKIIKNHIKNETLSRFNNRQCQFTICDSGPDTFHISCYSSQNKFTTVYSNISLQWLEKNSWKIPVFIMQQAALRVLWKTLQSRCPSDTVPRRERALISSLI